MTLIRPILAALALLCAACRPPFPPALGGGQVIFEESPGVHVTVSECARVATYTVALREAIEAAGPVEGLILIFHDGPSRYLGRSGERGYAMVQCEDWSSVRGLIEEHREEMSRP